MRTSFWQSNAPIAWLVAFALLVQLPSAMYFTHSIQTLLKPDWPDLFNWVIGGSFAVILEAAIFVWVMRGRLGLSWTFAIVSVVMNMTQLLDLPDTVSTYKLFGGAFVCILPPIAVALFSHEFRKPGKDVTQSPQLVAEVQLPDGVKMFVLHRKENQNGTDTADAVDAGTGSQA